MSVKLYKHNESGEVVAATLGRKDIFGKFRDYQILTAYKTKYTETCIKLVQIDLFKKEYTPLPEAPEVGSTAWDEYDLKAGLSALLNKHSVENDSNTPDFVLASLLNGFLKLFGDVCRERDKWYGQDAPWIESTAEAPKPIVELLPHEFVEGQEVLVRVKGEKWQRRTFCRLSCNGKKAHVFATELHDERVKSHKLQIHWKYFIPYAENAHLEGQITSGEHGAVPRGYVPPHVPKLGDETYWMVGDAIRNIATMALYKVMDVNLKTGVMTCEDTLLNRFHFKLNGRLCEKGIRVLYHYDENFIITGEVEDNPPTRPHKIIDTYTDGA